MGLPAKKEASSSSSCSNAENGFGLCVASANDLDYSLSSVVMHDVDVTAKRIVGLDDPICSPTAPSRSTEDSSLSAQHT